MTVWLFESAYFGIHEVWETAEAWRKFYESQSDTRLAPYGDGWNMYVEGRFSAVGTLRRKTVRN